MQQNPSFRVPFLALTTAALAGLLAIPDGRCHAQTPGPAPPAAMPEQGLAPVPLPHQRPSDVPEQPISTFLEAEPAASEWTSGRYRVTAGDVLVLEFPFVPELNQRLAVQPDGYVTLREVGDVAFQGRTLEQLRAVVHAAYEPMVREPVFTLVLTEFEKPYFIAAGEVEKPGRYDLRGPLTLTQALAYAGGSKSGGRLSEVVLFRRFGPDALEVKQVDVKKMYAKRDLSEDPLLRPGDTVFVPKSTLGKLAPIISRISLGLYLNPFSLFDR